MLVELLFHLRTDCCTQLIKLCSDESKVTLIKDQYKRKIMRTIRKNKNKFKVEATSRLILCILFTIIDGGDEARVRIKAVWM